MARQTLAFRRKQQGKTDYRKRLKLIQSGKPRLVIRRSLKNIIVQFVEFNVDGDKILAQARSSELSKYGWKGPKGNLPAAYLTGLLAGKKAKAKVKEAIVDLGLYQSTKGSRLYAALKGAVDAGVAIPHDKSVLPSDDRAQGKHIEERAKQLKEKSTEEYEKYFADYIKAKIDPIALSSALSQVKEKISSDAK